MSIPFEGSPDASTASWLPEAITTMPNNFLGVSPVSLNEFRADAREHPIVFSDLPAVGDAINRTDALGAVARGLRLENRAALRANPAIVSESIMYGAGIASRIIEAGETNVATGIDADGAKLALLIAARHPDWAPWTAGALGAVTGETYGETLAAQAVAHILLTKSGIGPTFNEVMNDVQDVPRGVVVSKIFHGGALVSTLTAILNGHQQVR